MTDPGIYYITITLGDDNPEPQQSVTTITVEILPLPAATINDATTNPKVNSINSTVAPPNNTQPPSHPKESNQS